MRLSKPHKYRAKPCVIDGTHFPSQAEGRRYQELRLMEKAGEISELEVHPRYPITINNQKVCIVELDFAYLDQAAQRHYVDCKGMDTALSKLKRKLIFAVHAITVEIVR